MTITNLAAVDDHLRRSARQATWLSAAIVMVTVPLTAILTWHAITSLPTVSLAWPAITVLLMVLVGLIILRSGDPKVRYTPQGVDVPSRDRLAGWASIVFGLATAVLIVPVAYEDNIIQTRTGLLAAGVLAILIIGLSRTVAKAPRGLRLNRQGINQLGGASRPIVPWDSVRARPAKLARHADRVSLYVDFGGSPSLTVGTRYMPLKMWEMITVAEHLRDHPDDRQQLDDPATARQLIETIRAYPIPADAQHSPRWFRPPPTSMTAVDS